MTHDKAGSRKVIGFRIVSYQFNFFPETLLYCGVFKKITNVGADNFHSVGTCRLGASPHLIFSALSATRLNARSAWSISHASTFPWSTHAQVHNCIDGHKGMHLQLCPRDFLKNHLGIPVTGDLIQGYIIAYDIAAGKAQQEGPKKQVKTRQPMK